MATKTKTKTKTKKTTKTPEKVAAKKTPAGFPPAPRRVYGATVFVKRVIAERDAAALVRDHGFRLIDKSAEGYRLQADAMAYRSYKGE